MVAAAGDGGGDDGDGGQVVAACAPCLGSGVVVGGAIPAAHEHRVTCMAVVVTLDMNDRTGKLSDTTWTRYIAQQTRVNNTTLL